MRLVLTVIISHFLIYPTLHDGHLIFLAQLYTENSSVSPFALSVQCKIQLIRFQ